MSSVAVVGLAAAGVFAWDRLATRELALPAEPGAPRVHCARHPISAAEWWLEGPGERGAWRAELPGSGALEPADLESRWSPTPGAWEPRRRDWAVYALDAEPRPCSDELPVPEWLEEVEPPVEEEPPVGSDVPPELRYGIGVRADPPDPHMAALAVRDRHRHERTLSAGSVAATPRRSCLVEVAAGLRWCAESESAPLDRAVVPGTALVEVLDLAPRVLVGRSLDDGRALWRTVVPEDAADVWLVRATDGGLGVRANEDFFALEPATGELVRVTPDGGEACSLLSVVVALGGGVLGATLVHPARWVELARVAPGGSLGCPRSAGAWVIVSAPPVEAPVAEPVRLVDPMSPPAGGVALYLMGPDATLLEAWSLPWARAVTIDHRGMDAETDAASVALRHDEAGLHLASPNVP